MGNLREPHDPHAIQDPFAHQTQFGHQYPPLQDPLGDFQHFNGMDPYEYLYGEHAYVDADAYLGHQIEDTPHHNTADYLDNPANLDDQNSTATSDGDKNGGEVTPLYEHPAAYGHVSHDLQ